MVTPVTAIVELLAAVALTVPFAIPAVVGAQAEFAKNLTSLALSVPAFFSDRS